MIGLRSMDAPERKEGSPDTLEKLRDKLQRAYARRDYYAQQYHQTKAELDETKWQLGVAHNKIKQMQTQMSKMKIDLLECHSSRNDQTYVSERNGKISPDSGSVCMSSPGVESNEGHVQIEDDSTEGTENRVQKYSQKINGMNEALNQSGELKPTKRVVFRDVPPLVANPQHNSHERIKSGSQHNPYVRISTGPQHSSHERINGMTQSGLQRSYTYDQADICGPFLEGGNLKMQRTNSYSHGRGNHPQMQYSTFPCTNYTIFPHQIQHQPPYSSTFSLPGDQHRLPRVHRTMPYDNMGPGIVSPPYQQPPPPPRIIQNQGPHPPPVLPPQPSAFQRVVQNQGNIRMHHYENVVTYPPTHLQSYPGYQPMVNNQDQHKKQHSFAERWTYNGLNHDEFARFLNHLSQPNVTVGHLEISRSNLGKPELMDAFCKELRRNSTITELSLPNNDIGQEALKILLPAVASCKRIKDLRLVNNDIGEECLDILKQFLENSALKLVLLTGNEIEHHTHLLDVQLPQDMSYEGVSENKSVPTSPNSSSLPQSMRHLQI